MAHREVVVSLDTYPTTTLFILMMVVSILFTPFSSGAATTANVPSVFRYSFNTDGTLMEAGNMGDSSSPYFWLNSGGKFVIRGGLGQTVQGALSAGDATRTLYSKMNALDTANGTNPQNTLRLVTRSVWQDAQESVKFRITKTNLTNTPNRDGYSGVFLFGRYHNQHNLYYAGIRQDGQAVIKKKINGTYYTLGEKQVFGSQDQYDRWSKPNLMPEWQWMGLRMRYEDLADGSVRVQLFLDKNNSGNYTQILSVTDKGTGGAPLKAGGNAGIRTDYMDVQFEDFELRKI